MVKKSAAPPPSGQLPLGEAAPAAQPAPAAPAPAAAAPAKRADVEDGMYAGTSFTAYWSWPRVHHSDLVEFNRSAAHAREAMRHPSAPTPALDFGHAVHAAVLEPAVFASTHVKGPQLPDGSRPDRRTTLGKNIWTEFEAEHRGKEIMEAADYERCLSIREAVYAHPYARKILEARGANEVGIAWTDRRHNVKCKARTDRYGQLPDGWPTMFDLKTTEDASPRAFEKWIHKYDAHQQAAFYLDGAAAIEDVHRRFVFIVAEKAPPFVVVCYELNEDSIEQGRFEYRRNLRTLVECTKSGRWPGYADNDLLAIDLPAYALTVRE